jgi:uncharacterized protein YggU (UPF0235/DUF167 family)
MRNLTVILLIGFALLLAGCGGAVAPFPGALETPTAGIPVLDTPTAVPPVQPTATHIPVDLTPAQRAAIATLAQSLGVPADKISLVSAEAVTWPNGCMGIQRLGVLCTQNEVPGFKIILKAGDKQYEVHTNQDGSVVAPEQALQAPGPAEEAAVNQLATNLGIPKSDVKVVSTTAIEWPDSCMGVAQRDIMCAQVVTPGYLILLEAGGRQYEYHTNQDASMIMPGSLGLSWTQQGGIAGLCQNLEVYLSGEIYATDCKAGGDSRTGVLKAADRDQLTAWVDKLSMTAIDLSDPKGVSDAMTRQASLNGTGTGKATDKEEHEIYTFGQTLYHSLYQ